MNSDEIWLLQLFSGTIGAFVAAVIGGLVAIMVVRLTNKQQRKNAIEEREIDALADLISAVHSISMTFTDADKFDAGAYANHLEKAILKLHLGGPDVRQLAEALDYWPSRMLTLCTLHHIAERKDVELPVDVDELMTKIQVAVTFDLRHWHEESEASKASKARAMEVLGEDMKAALVQINEVLDVQKAAKEIVPEPTTN